MLEQIDRYSVYLSMSTYVINPTIEQEKLITAFLEEQQISFYKEDEKLPQHVLDGIDRGIADADAGRFITHEEFVKRLAIGK